MTFNPEAFDLAAGLVRWVFVFGGCIVVGFLVALLVGLLTGGGRGVHAVVRGLFDGLNDLLHTSPARVWAVAQLTYREAVRRKALLVFVVFALLFMFAGWFLSNANNRADLQVKVHVSFVLRTIEFLVLPVALLLACWGIPEDVRRRSLHTVMTKPVRRAEVVMGRMLGYVGISTLVVLVMGVVGFVWILRQVPVGPDGQSPLISRVPVYGTLTFISPEGLPEQRGINVGDIWEFRSYIAGASSARGVYTFENVTPDVLRDVLLKTSADDAGTVTERLQLESEFEAFRTNKGDMTRGLHVQYTYVNPADPTKRVVDPNVFAIQEYQENIQSIPRTLAVADEAGESRSVDVFKELVAPEAEVAVDYQPDGTPITRTMRNVLRVEVRCLDPGQYLGMAPVSLFIRTPDRPFAVGFFKALAGIWLMTVLVIVLGVTVSTFTKGPVATLLTACLVLVGLGFRERMDLMTSAFVGGDAIEGGGPVESILRIINHMNPTTPLPDSAINNAIQWVDQGFIAGLSAIKYLVPDFRVFGLSEYVANRFDVGWSTGLLPALAMTLAFIPPCLLLSDYALRSRELEAK